MHGLSFSSYGEQGLLFAVVRGLLIAVAFCAAEHGLYVHGLQYLWYTGLVAPWHVESSQTRDQTCVSCTGW